MAAWDVLGAFLLATLLFAYMPGPALIYTAAQTMARGRKAGFMAALGLHLGGYVHVFAAALGLAALFQFVPPLYTALKIAGALYLLWLGIAIIRQKPASGAAAEPAPVKSGKRAFAESVVVEILNPKSALFYVAFLPQFVDPAGAWPVWTQFLLLGAVVNALFGSADVVAVLLTHRVLVTFGTSGWRERLARVFGGSLLIALGARLAFVRD